MKVEPTDPHRPAAGAERQVCSAGISRTEIADPDEQSPCCGERSGETSRNVVTVLGESLRTWSGTIRLLVTLSAVVTGLLILGVDADLVKAIVLRS
ncbi:hypothetical protein [Actinokineospora pegani]|uniref:hypothetical protein n=1 Tax=Actinokineospora pegani TaxID=2654637 RepID=UPI0012EABF8B|nr:hypothetical protein [Actinokineospora pegani]